MWDTSCTNYMSEVDAIGVPKTRYEGRYEGKGTRGVMVIRKDQQQVLQAHLYILNNTDDVIPFSNEYKMLLKSVNPRANEKWLLNEHNKTFLKWFKEKIGEKACDVEHLKWLARGPNFDVITWSGYDINKLSFYTNTELQTHILYLCKLFAGDPPRVVAIGRVYATGSTIHTLSLRENLSSGRRKS